MLNAPEDHYDAHAQPPEDVAQGLRNLKPTMRLRLNRRGKAAKGASLDANGLPRHVVYEPRWELWDTDDSGRDYKVMVLRDGQDNYLPPGQWVVDRFRKYNPQNFGSIKDMLDFFDAENQAGAGVNERDWRSFTDFITEWAWDRIRSNAPDKLDSPSFD